MAHAIIRGANGRRHEVDFEDVEITVEVFFCDEIAVEAPKNWPPSDKRRLALLNVPRVLFKGSRRSGAASSAETRVSERPR
jgi:hypothetical protein